MSNLVPSLYGSEFDLKDFGAQGDGSTDDYAAFKLAIAAAAGNGTLHITEGTYIFRDISTYAIPLSDLHIVADPNAIIKIPTDAVVGTATTSAGWPLKGVFCSDQVPLDSAFVNFSWTGGKIVIEKDDCSFMVLERNNCTDFLVKDVIIDGKGTQTDNKAAFGIHTRFFDRVTFDNVQVSNTKNSALKPEITNTLVIKNCKFENIAVNGSYVPKVSETMGTGLGAGDWWAAWAVSAPACTDVECVNNYFHTIGSAAISFRGGTSNPLKRVLIRDNLIYNSGKGGIGCGMQSTTGDVDHLNITIENNRIFGYAQRDNDAGIQVNNQSTVKGGEHIIVRNNYISYWNTEDGEDNTTYNHHAADSENISYGITITAPAIATDENKNVICEGNIIENTISAGINFEAMFGSCSNNILNNVCYGYESGFAGVFNYATPLYSAGIIIKGYGITATNNKIRDAFSGYTSGSAPMILWEANKSTLSDCVLHNDGTTYESGYAVTVSDAYVGGTAEFDSPLIANGGLISTIKNIKHTNCSNVGVYNKSATNTVIGYNGKLNVKDFGVAGDGVTDDTSAIQAIFTGLSGGETVYFPEGTYLSDKVTLSSKNNVTIIGEGVTLYRPFATFATADRNIDVSSCNHILIKGFHLDGDNAAATNARGGIYFTSSDFCKVEDIHSIDTRQPIILDDCEHCIISNCTAEQAVALTPSYVDDNTAGYYLVTFSNTIAACKYCIVENCTVNGTMLMLDQFGIGNKIVNCSSQGLSPDSVIYFSGSEDFICTGNTVYKAGKDCIKAINSCVGGTIANNSVYWSAEVVTNSPHGIQVDSSDYITVTGNYVQIGPTTRTATPGYGIAIWDTNHITITGNTVWMDTTTGGQEDGIRIQTVNDTLMQNIICNTNTIFGMGRYGIYVSPGAGETIKDVIISDNTIRGFSNTTSDFGIALLANATGTLESCDVHHNKISNVEQGGLYLSDGNGGTLTDIYITSNSFRDMNVNAEPIYCNGVGGTWERVIVDKNHHDGTPNATFFTQASADIGMTVLPTNLDDGVIVNFPRSIDGTTVTSPHTLQAWDSGIQVDNTGATGLVTATLPAAIKGMNFVFERVATQTMRVDPAGTEYFADVGTHGYKSLDSDGTYMKIECFKDGVWHVVASDGTITNE